MHREYLAAGAVALVALATSARAQDADPALVDVLVVTAERPSRADVVRPDAATSQGPDAADLVARVPGAAVIDNGALSGQVQYRGLFGPRVGVRVDGQSFSSGGPNLMDPPLHYAPLGLVSRVEVDRSVAPVRDGPGLGGSVDAVFKKIDFTEDPSMQPGYDVTVSGRTGHDAYGVGGVAGLANDRLRGHVLFSYEQGEDAPFPGGRIASSSYERSVYGLGAGARLGQHEFSLDLRRQHTGPTGNPPFAMDIRYFDTDFVRAVYAGPVGRARVDAAVGYADVEHGMDNFSLRPAPASPAMARESFAGARTLTAELGLSFDAAGGVLRLGGDVEDANKGVRIESPHNAAFWVASLPDVAMRRAGAYGEWRGQLAGWDAEIGARLDRHEAKAGETAFGPALPAGQRGLAAAFNAADRSWDDVTVDGVVKLWRQTSEAVGWRVTLARKTRAPGYVERFAWLPTEASAGLADGNNYVGGLDLSPETAWTAEAGLDWRNEVAYARPTVFYRRVDDFIQGVAYDATPDVVDSAVETVSSAAGDATPLRFANVDAEFYGADLDFGVRIAERWRLDGVASVVRGERRDIDDDVYRIAPSRLLLDLTYDRDTWSTTLESVLVGDQDRVSAANSERPTSGYAVFNLIGRWRAPGGVQFTGGVENLFDERYEEHLGGLNRIAGSDVPLRGRLPGPGRAAFVRVNVVR